MRRLVSCLLALICITATTEVSAQRANYESILIGERAIGMGGAFTAVADDASAFHYNPAGLAQAETGGLSLSANTYGFFKSTVKGKYVSRDGAADDVRSGTLIYPNALVYVMPLADMGLEGHTIAFGVTVPHFFRYRGHVNVSVHETTLGADGFFDRSDTSDAVEGITYAAGPAYAVRLGRLHLGASVKLRYASDDVSREFAYTTVREGVASRDQAFYHLDASHFGITGDLGLLYRAPRWSIGLRVGLPMATLWQGATLQLHESGSANSFDGGSDTFVLFQDTYRDVDAAVNHVRPTQVSLGGSLGASRALQVSADVRVYAPIAAFNYIDGKRVRPALAPGEIFNADASEMRTFDPTERDPGRQLVVNGAVGASLGVAETMTLMLGAFTDFSGLPEGETIATSERVDQFGASLAIQRGDAGGTLTAGVYGTYGTGLSEAIDFSELTSAGMADVTQWTMSVFLAGSNPFGAD